MIRTRALSSQAVTLGLTLFVVSCVSPRSNENLPLDPQNELAGEGELRAQAVPLIEADAAPAVSSSAAVTATQATASATQATALPNLTLNIPFPPTTVTISDGKPSGLGIYASIFGLKLSLNLDLFSDWFNPPATEPKDPADGVLWEPIKVADIRAQKKAFDWAKTTPLSETSTFTYTIDGVPTPLPPMQYAEVYVRNPDQLRELEEMGVHWSATPFFESEWPDPTKALYIPATGDDEDNGATFVFALIPTPVYNAIRAETLAGEDTYAALFLRPIPTDARAADGTINWTYLLANLTEYAPISTELTDEGEVSTPVEYIEADGGVAQDQKRIGRRLRRWVAKVAKAGRFIVDTVRRGVGWSANLFLKSKTLHIYTKLNNRTDAPMVRAWDDGSNGFGKPLTLRGTRVNVTGVLRNALYKGQIDGNGRADIKVPKNLKVQVCFESDAPAGRIQSGVFRAAWHCWPRFTPNSADEENIGSATAPKAVGDTEFYDLALLIDARDYASQVMGFKPKKVSVQAGALAQVMTVGSISPAYTPCLYTARAPISLVNAYADTLNSGSGLGDLFEFFWSTDIVLAKSARWSRNTAVHEYGHFFFCSLLADERWEAFNVVWSQVIRFKNLNADSTEPVKALNEGFADWFASQVTGSANYFAAPSSFNESSTGNQNGKFFVDSAAPGKGQGFEANIGGPKCPSGYDRNVPSGCVASTFTGTALVVGTVTTLLQDAIDRGACGTNSTCLSEKRSAGAPFNTTSRPFTAVDKTLRHVGDEVIEMSPKNLTQFIRDFANANWVGGTALSYANFYGALAERLSKLNYSYHQICNLFALHSSSNSCPEVTAPSEGTSKGPVIFQAKPPKGGSVTGLGSTSGPCAATSCSVYPNSNVTLVASPNVGFTFKNWTCTNTTITSTQANNPSLFLTDVSPGVNCTANFNSLLPQITLDFTPNPPSAGKVNISGAPAGSCITGSCMFPAGTSVTLSAAANTGFHFTAWSNCSTSTNPTLPLPLLTNSKTCIANFAMDVPTSFTVLANVGTTGGGTVSPATQTVAPNGSATIIASPSAGFRFGAWSGSSGCAGSNSSLTIPVVAANTSCTANFVRVVQVSFATDASAGLGAAISANVLPSGNACSNGLCTFDAGGGVKLVQTPGFLQTAVGWYCTDSASGAVTSSAGSSAPQTLVLNSVQNNTSCVAKMQNIILL